MRARVRWSGITPSTARREQSCSADGGATRETSRFVSFTRADPDAS